MAETKPGLHRASLQMPGDGWLPRQSTHAALSAARVVAMPRYGAESVEEMPAVPSVPRWVPLQVLSVGPHLARERSQELT